MKPRFSESQTHCNSQCRAIAKRTGADSEQAPRCARFPASSGCFVPPAQRVQTSITSSSLRGVPSGLVAIEDDLALEAHHPRHGRGQLADRHILPRSDVDQRRSILQQQRSKALRRRGSSETGMLRRQVVGIHEALCASASRFPRPLMDLDPAPDAIAWAVLCISAGSTCEVARSKLSSGP